ncbi:cytochrome c maturation protein CcmE [Roseivirga sp. BDSF3-8]|uniref:cytochrome c maturation protein CcmE domain-containing protein n=1 Tax=Roseivirga sp. BDSF3-8 TaxID=3241598 RepID=UPI00353235EB
MKVTHIIGIAVIAVAIMVIISVSGNASSYVTFKEARSLSDTGSDNSIHIVGELKKDATGQIVGIQESPSKLSFSFVMIDENQDEQKVYFGEPVPPDFTKSEKVVVVGSYKNEAFVADKILLKCPSKYQEDVVITSSNN